MNLTLRVFSLFSLLLCSSVLAAGPEPDVAELAQAYRSKNQPVRAQADGAIVCEAEEFRTGDSAWEAKNWGSNYYAATFANTFLSRKAYLSAPPTGERSVATIQVDVPAAGSYLVLARYEAAFRFETQFHVVVEQGGQKKLDRLYGARKNPKVWAFSKQLQPEVEWPWGAVENVVWEGHDAAVQLAAGRAQISLIADPQTGDAAKRNVDLLLLTPDKEGVQTRIEKENYLPLDGLLTQAGDVALRVKNEGASPLVLKMPPCTEHSPYWVHLRNWKAESVEVAAGKTSGWVEVGGLLDSLNDGQWNLSAAAVGDNSAVKYTVEVAVRDAAGKLGTIATFESTQNSLPLAFDAATRYTRRIRRSEAVLTDLVTWLKQQKVHGKKPTETLILGYTFSPRDGAQQYNAEINQFTGLFGLTPTSDAAYIDVRGKNPAQLEEICLKLKEQGLADKVRCVSLGDEIGLPNPPGNDHEGFRAWLKQQKLTPKEVDPAAGNWEAVMYSPAAGTADAKPGLYYWSQRYRHAYGIQRQKTLTDALRKHLPNALIGANFSPHHEPAYLGETYKWVTLFREEGMTMPWSEDYIWQIPVGSQQMNFLNLALCRAGLRDKPKGKIHWYVMPHWPGNTAASWRRQFFGDLAGGVQIVNLFEFRPVQAAYTENHVSLPEMFQTVRQGFYELGQFEDIIQAGQPQTGTAALWFSETGDLWNDNREPFTAAKRALFVAAQHQQLGVDAVVEADALSGVLGQYQVLYLADQHVSKRASQAIAAWVKAGGRLFATVGAGSLDESDQPNTVLLELLGIKPGTLEEEASVKLIKQDLPFAKVLDQVSLADQEGTLPVIAARGKFRAGQDCELLGKFSDGSPAVTLRKVGKGEAVYCGFLPSLSYFQPAIPRQPVDRGATDDSMAHFLPTEFHAGASSLIGYPPRDVARPWKCSSNLVVGELVQAPAGAVFPVVNWSSSPVEELQVTLRLPAKYSKFSLASGGSLEAKRDGENVSFSFNLEIADAIIIR